MKRIENEASNFVTYYEIKRDTYPEFPSTGKKLWLVANYPKYLIVKLIASLGINTVIDAAVIMLSFVALSLLALYFCHKYYSFEYQNAEKDNLITALNAKVDSLTQSNDSLAAVISTSKMHEWVWEGFANRSSYGNPTSDIVKRIAAECGSSHPEVVARVVRLESANGTTPLSKRTNNVTGMCKSTERKSTRTKNFSTEGTYSEYEHWIHSVVDFILWEQMFDTRELDDDEYCDFLQEKYNRNETKDYAKRLKSIKIG